MTAKSVGVDRLVVGRLYRIVRECTITVSKWKTTDPNSSAARLGVVGRKFEFMVLAEPIARKVAHTAFLTYDVLVLAVDGSTGHLCTSTVNDANLKYEPLGLLRMVEEII